MTKGRLLLGLFCLALAWPSYAQNGTPHGVSVTWTAVPVAAGYNIYRCPGTCLTTGTWTKIDVSLDLTNGYLDQSASLVSGSVYSYAATAVDVNGNESAFSNIATVTYAAIVNPPAPSGCAARPQ